MLPQRNGQFPLKILFVLVFHLLLTSSCRGQSQVVGPSQPIVARVDDDVILPCRLDPAEDAFAMILEWTRPDLNPEFVHMRQAGQDLGHSKNPSYTDRTSMFVDELKHGNISLKLSRVRPSDAGTYRCYLPKMDKDAFVTLVVGADSSPAIVSIDKTSGGVDLQCESEGWYPEPEVLWLDSEGHVLSAGPTETVRGPDGLYTVSSRVTVDKRHRNNFTCRVQQKNINQTRETHIYISDDFFEVQSSSSAPIIIILVVLLTFCSVFIFAVFFSVCKWRQIIKTRRSHGDETDKTNKTKEDREKAPLRTGGTVEMEDLEKGEKQKDSKPVRNRNLSSSMLSWNPYKLFKEELQRREEAENKLKEEKETREREQQNLKTQLDDKIIELEDLISDQKQKKEEAENDLGTKTQELKEEKERREKELEDLKTQLDAKITELTEEKKKREEELEDKTKELENLISDQKQKEEKTEEDLKELRTENQKLTEEKEKQEKERLELQKKLENKERELTEEKTRRENEWKKLKTELETKNKELTEQKKRRERELKDVKTQLEAQIKQLTDEKQRVENERQTLQTKLENKERELTEQKKRRERELEAQIKQLTEEKKAREEELKDLKTQLEAQIKQLTDEKERREEELEIKNKELTEEKQKLQKEVEKLTEEKKKNDGAAAEAAAGRTEVHE